MSVGRIGLFGSGRVDRQGVSIGRVGLFGSGRGDKFGPFRLVVRIGVGVFEPMRLRKFDVGGRLGIVWTKEGYWIHYWVMRVESVWTWFGPSELSGPWTGLMDYGS